MGGVKGVGVYGPAGAACGYPGVGYGWFGGWWWLWIIIIFILFFAWGWGGWGGFCFPGGYRRGC